MPEETGGGDPHIHSTNFPKASRGCISYPPGIDGIDLRALSNPKFSYMYRGEGLKYWQY